MATCSEMKKNQIYTCKNCGIEIEVIKECEKTEDGKCCNKDICHFVCCGEKLTKK